jgi:hypothetical protein
LPDGHLFTSARFVFFRYWYIFALFVQFWLVPQVSRVYVLSIPFSDKSFTYLIGLQVCVFVLCPEFPFFRRLCFLVCCGFFVCQLFMASIPSSITAALSGLIAGLIWHSFTCLSAWRPAPPQCCCNWRAESASSIVPNSPYAPVPQDSDAIPLDQQLDPN